MRMLSLVFAATAFVATPALAAPCKDAKGRFIKCPPAATATSAAKTTTTAKTMTITTKKAPCRDAKGRFKKC